MTVPFSVLDLVPQPSDITSTQALRNSIDLARRVDELGYTRHWFAEHHNMSTVVSTTPEILIALAAEATRGIRVGSGGIMLPNHTPLKVAESFKMLEALHPGRIDLGIGRAPGTDTITARTLRGNKDDIYSDDFPHTLAELVAFGHNAKPSPVRGVEAIPNDNILPPVFLLGSSDYSAHLSAKLGMGFGFAAHFSEFPPDYPMNAYRHEFQPVGGLKEPHAILTLSVICAETDTEAERLASSLIVAFTRLRTRQTSILLPPDEALAYKFSPVELEVAESLRPLHIVGSPERVKQRITELIERTKADEVMITTFTYAHADRIRSYELLAEAFGLTPRN